MVYSCAADGIYASGDYSNVYCELCRNSSQEEICNPPHSMSENILLNDDLINFNGSYVTLQANAVTYVADTGFIPMERLSDAATGKYVDYGYQGRIILFGEEYFVKDISGNSPVYAYKGAQRNISSEGFLGEYNDYKFRVDSLVYSGSEIVGINLNVEQPDQTVVQVQLTKIANGIVGGVLELAILDASEGESVKTASIIIYNTTTQVTLEDEGILEMSGETKDNWIVDLSIEEQPFGGNMDISCYENINTNQKVLSNITITYNESLIMAANGGFLLLPSGYQVVSNGTNMYATSSCTLTGDYPPCDVVNLSEVIDLINLWASGQATISNVIDLINAWESV